MNSTFKLMRTHAPPATRSALAVCLAALLAACGGGSSGGDSANASSTSPPATAPIGSTTPTVPTLQTTTQTVTPATEASLAVPASGGLVDYFKQKLIAGGAATVVTTAAPVGAATSPAPSAAALSEPVGAASFAGTTLQERGVDENDWVKTDGSMLYALSKAYSSNTGTPTAAVLQAQRRLADGQLEPVGRLALPNELTYSGMYLVGSANRVALLGQRFEFSNALPPIFPPTISAVSAPSGSVTSAIGSGTAPIGSGPAVTLPTPSVSLLPGPQIARTGIDLLATPASGAVTATLSVSTRIRIDGSLVGSRVIGSTLYVVSNWQPDLRKYAIPANATPARAQAAVAGLTAAEILPTITIDGGTAQPLVAEGDCYVQAGNASLDRQVTTITAFNLASASLQRTSRCFLGGSQALYMSPAAVYLASSRYFNYGGNGAQTVALTIAPAGSKTDIHKFALAGQNIDYRGTGEVAGHLGWDADKNAYRMSEHQGDLRVLTFTGAQGWSVLRNGTSTTATPVPAASPATLTVLREAPSASKTLQVVASLPNAQRPAAIGKPGEQVYAVQFVGTRAYVVTFRRTDPLYVLDLSNPADPKTIGELEIPGYSDYLYPLGDALLLGVGKDANDGGVAQGVKVALMDVSDPSKPSIRSSLVLGKRGSASGLDASSRGINLFQQGDVWRIAMPVRLNETPVANVSGFFDPTTQGLARFEVDTKAKTMVPKPMVTSLTFPATNPYSLTYGQYDLGQERSVQIESFVYYFSGGSLRASSW